MKMGTIFLGPFVLKLTWAGFVVYWIRQDVFQLINKEWRFCQMMDFPKIVIDSEGICFASYVVFLLHSLSEMSFDQFCNEMWLISTALFNCKNCCEMQIHSHDKVQTELLSELWRETPWKSKDCFSYSASFRGGRERADFAHQCGIRWCQV